MGYGGQNGWTNYETWRVNLEIFGDCYEDFLDYDKDSLKEYVQEMLEMDCNNKTTLSYATAFINNVNFYEILEHIENYKNENFCDECNANLDDAPTEWANKGVCSINCYTEVVTS